MYLGKICEIGPADRSMSRRHPYTEFLLGAALEADPTPHKRAGPPGRAAEPDEPTERLVAFAPLSERDPEVRRRRAVTPEVAPNTWSRATNPFDDPP